MQDEVFYRRFKCWKKFGEYLTPQQCFDIADASLTDNIATEFEVEMMRSGWRLNELRETITDCKILGLIMEVPLCQQ